MCKDTGCCGKKSCVQCGGGAPLPTTPIVPNIYIDNTSGDVYYWDGENWVLKEAAVPCIETTIEKKHELKGCHEDGTDIITLSHPYSEIAKNPNEDGFLLFLNGKQTDADSLPQNATLQDNGAANATILVAPGMGEPGRPCCYKLFYWTNETIFTLASCDNPLPPSIK